MQRVYDLRNTFTIASANLSGGDDSNQTTACDGNARPRPRSTCCSRSASRRRSRPGNESHPTGVGAAGVRLHRRHGRRDHSQCQRQRRRQSRQLFEPRSRGSTCSRPVRRCDSRYRTTPGPTSRVRRWPRRMSPERFAALRHAYPTRPRRPCSPTCATPASTSPTRPARPPTRPRRGSTCWPPCSRATTRRPSARTPERSRSTRAAPPTTPVASAIPKDGRSTLTASSGNVVDAGGGRWIWSSSTNDGPTQSRDVTITATDDKGETAATTFRLTVNERCAEHHHRSRSTRFDDGRRVVRGEGDVRRSGLARHPHRSIELG